MNIDNIKRLEQFTAMETANLIRNEHPQIIALILTFLNCNYSAEVLVCFTERLRDDVVLRIATIDQVNSRWIKLLDDNISKRIAAIGDNRIVNIDSTGNSRKIIRALPTNFKTSVLDAIREYDPELCQKIMD